MPDNITFGRRDTGKVSMDISADFPYQSPNYPSGYYIIDSRRVSISTNPEKDRIFFKSENHHMLPEGVPVTEIANRPSDDGVEVVNWLDDNFFFEKSALIGALGDGAKLEAAALMLDAMMEFTHDYPFTWFAQIATPNDPADKLRFQTLLNDIY